jgi:hypothetical protein
MSLIPEEGRQWQDLLTCPARSAPATSTKETAAKIEVKK